MWQLSHCHLHGLRDKDQRVDQWGMVSSKLLKRWDVWDIIQRPLTGLGSGRLCFWSQPRCCGWIIKSSVPLSLLPNYLTLVKHYMAQQRVHRANSYPPELAFLHSYERASIKKKQLVVKFEGQFWLNYAKKIFCYVVKAGQKATQTEMLDLLILPVLTDCFSEIWE